VGEGSVQRARRGAPEDLVEYGRIAAELKRIGRPMQQIDIQITAIAFALGNCTVVSGDSDLKAVPGLSVEDWVAEGGGNTADVKGVHHE
jgi:predicted nucleic acid-binding protein